MRKIIKLKKQVKVRDEGTRDTRRERDQMAADDSALGLEPRGNN